MPTLRAGVPRPPRERIPGDLLVLIGAALIVALGFGLIAPILPQYAKSFQVTDAAAAAIISVFAATRLIFAPVAGRIVERFGERVGYVVGVLVVALSTLGCSVAPDYWLLLLARGIGGFGSTMFSVSAGSFLARRAPTHLRGRVQGLYGGAFLFGNVTGPLVGGVLSPLGFRAPFLIYGVALILAAAVVFVLLERSAASRALRGTPLPPLSLRQAWAFPPFRAALIGNAGNGWVTFGVRTALVPLFASAALGASPLAVGAVLTAFALGNGGALSFSGRWSDAVGRRTPILLGMSCAAVLSALVGFAPNVPVLVVISALAGFSTGLFAPSQQATVADTVGHEHSAGRAMASFQMSADLPAIIAPIAAGAVADTLGYEWAFLGSGVLMFAGVIAWSLVREPTRS